MEVDERYQGPWPAANVLLLAELEAYLVDAERPEVRGAPTICEPWTGDQLTAHVVATFRRFNAMLARSRSGDFTPPFERSALAEENMRAVAGFGGDPLAELRTEVEKFCEAAIDPAEVMAHQFGPVPVGLQAAFGLGELAVHHDDLAVSVGERYRPPDPVIEVLVPAYAAARGSSAPTDSDDPWAAVLAWSGRRLDR